MNRRTARAAGLVALLMGAGTLVQPVHAVAPAPQNTCSGAFCVTFDLVTYDALAPTQPTTAAAQPTNLALRFTDTSSAVATDKSTWLAKVSAVLGSTSSKAFAVTAPDQLPLGAYVAGTAATASGCAAATDFAAACPAGSGTGLVEVGGAAPDDHQGGDLRDLPHHHRCRGCPDRRAHGAHRRRAAAQHDHDAADLLAGHRHRRPDVDDGHPARRDASGGVPLGGALPQHRRPQPQRPGHRGGGRRREPARRLRPPVAALHDGHRHARGQRAGHRHRGQRVPAGSQGLSGLPRPGVRGAGPDQPQGLHVHDEAADRGGRRADGVAGVRLR